MGVGPCGDCGDIQRMQHPLLRGVDASPAAAKVLSPSTLLDHRGSALPLAAGDRLPLV